MKEEMTKEEIKRDLASLEIITTMHEVEKLKLEEQLKEIEEAEKPKFNEPEKEGDFSVENYIHTTNTLYGTSKTLNYKSICRFKTQEQANQRAKEIRVYNLLKNFSDANGGDEIDWVNFDKVKYSIECYCINNCKTGYGFIIQEHKTRFFSLEKIYFISCEVALEALRRYRKELEELR